MAKKRTSHRRITGSTAGTGAGSPREVLLYTNATGGRKKGRPKPVAGKARAAAKKR